MLVLMKITVWEAVKLSAWLVTFFLVSLMAVVYIIDYNNPSMNIMFYFNKIFIIIIIWILLYVCKFIFKKISILKSIDKNEKK
tara:strand:+ start:199 stop:447 length:249 start_codon:yes stop_codon:yes gene_type:complete